MSKLKQLITDDMKLAMKAQDKSALKAIRMILGAIKQKEIDERINLDDTQVLAVICLLYTSPSPRDRQKSRMPSSA